MELSIFGFHSKNIFEPLGLTHPFWTLHLDTIVCTWFGMICLFTTCKVITFFLKKRPESLVPFAAEYVTTSLISVTTETLGQFDTSSFIMAFSLFLFSFFCTLVSMIPHVEEATRDINTTFAIALISFCFVQYKGFKIHGLSHLKEYVHPFILMLPMHIIGDLAKITSMSFRLFGNILAGSVILQLMFIALTPAFPYLAIYAIIIAGVALIFYLLKNQLPSIAPLNEKLIYLYGIFLLPAGLQLFFGLFEGLLQSGVIALLTLTYTGLTIQKADEEH